MMPLARSLRPCGTLAKFLQSTAFLLTLSCAPVHAELFGFDPGYTSLVFSWSHLGLTRQSARFSSIDGSADIDPEAPEKSTLDVTIRAASVDSGNDTFDRILRSHDYFNAASSPTITFHAVSVVRTGEKTADVTGDLQIRGISKPVTMHVTLNLFGNHPAAAANAAYVGKHVAAFSATAEIRRSDWGIDRGLPLIPDEVEIAIETEMINR